MVLRVPENLDQVATAVMEAGTIVQGLHQLPGEIANAAVGSGVEPGLGAVEKTWGLAIHFLGDRIVDFTRRVHFAAAEYERQDRSYD